MFYYSLVPEMSFSSILVIDSDLISCVWRPPFPILSQQIFEYGDLWIFKQFIDNLQETQ